MTLEIISAEDVVFTGEVEAVTLPGSLGSFTVLRNHAPIISVLTAGTINYRTPQGEDKSYGIKGGLVDVNNNKIAVCIY